MSEESDLGYHGPVTSLQYHQWLAANDLESHIGSLSPSYVASQYLDLATDLAIENYLGTSSLYDCDRCEWVDLPSLERERDVRARFVEIIGSIIRGLGKSPVDGSTVREVHNTGFREFSHIGAYPVDHGTSPAVVIRATGPSFEDPAAHTSHTAHDVRMGYSNVSSCFEVITEDDYDEDEIYFTEQSSVFARFDPGFFPFMRVLTLLADKCLLNNQIDDSSGISFLRRKSAICFTSTEVVRNTAKQLIFTRSPPYSFDLFSDFRATTSAS